MNTDLAIPVCPYCGKLSQLVGGDRIYPHRKDLYSKKFYLCDPCNAYVGCHQGTQKPLGRLANKELRNAKMQAHRAFDPIWKSGQLSRSQAYAWLADRLGIPGDECHIGMFDVETCLEVVKAVGSLEKRLEYDPGKARKLWLVCQQWVKDNTVRSPESIYQRDDVCEALPDLAEAICEVVGFHQDP
jgi:hypothetical protein